MSSFKIASKSQSPISEHICAPTYVLSNIMPRTENDTPHDVWLMHKTV